MSKTIRSLTIMMIACLAHRAEAASLTWNASASAAAAADGSGVWNGSSTNWWNGMANTNWTSADPDTANFGAGNGAAGVVTVSGTQVVAGINFNFPGSGAYIINGGTLVLSNNATIMVNTNATIGSVLAGTSGLALAGSGTLTLSNANTYTGGTTINNGTLAITTTASALPVPVTINGGGTLALNAGGATYTNNLGGAGTVVVFTSGNTFLTGDHHLFAGTLDITNGAAGSKLVYGATAAAQGQLIAGGATIKVEAGDTFFGEQGSGNTLNFGNAIQLYGAGNSENLGALRIDKTGTIWSGPITLFGNSSIGNFSSGAGWMVTGVISENGGSFGLTKQGNGIITLTATNTYSGQTIISAGQLILTNTVSLTNSTVAINVNQGLVFATATNFVIGGLAGNYNLALTNLAGKAVTLSVGNNNADTTYNGVVSGPGSLVKVGAGTLTLGGSNAYMGGTIVNGGGMSLVSMTFTNLAGNLKIWPVGDSITYGSFGANGGYRGPLYNLLAPNAVTNFLFVGSSNNNAGITTLPPVEQYNEGHESYACDNIYTNLDGFDNSLYLEYGGASRDPKGGCWLTGTNGRPALFPDIILLLIGANERGNTNGATDRLDMLVSKLVTLRPAAKLIVARITPIPANASFVTSYNLGVDAVVAKYAASNLVSEVDLNTGFPTNGLSSDGLHPNDTGYGWMASQWYSAILALAPTTNVYVTSSIATNSLTVTAGATGNLGANPVAVSALYGAGNIVLGTGGMFTINNSGSDVFSGTISGTGNLTKSGGGTLILNGTNVYAGGTTVGAGELIVTPGFTGAGSLSVAANAAFGISNSIAASAVLSNAMVNAGATLEFINVSTPATPLAWTSNLMVNGACAIKITGTNGLAIGQSYPLVNYTGRFNGSFSSLQLQMPGSWPGTLVSNSQQIGLYVSLLPVAPANLAAVPGDAQVSLNWNNPGGAASFNVKRSPVSGGGYITITNVPSTAWVDPGVGNGKLCYYVVTATNSAGESGASGEVSARPTSLSPPQLGFSVNAGQIQLAWPADHTGWYLEVQTNSIAAGLGTNWFILPSSSSSNQMALGISLTNGNTFFRLVHP